MPHIEPFPGLRYAPWTDLARTIAPPYDVVGPEQREQLAGSSPYNAIHVELPVPPGDPYARAAGYLHEWRTAGVLIADEPSLYAYRMDFTDAAGSPRHTAGVIGALALGGAGGRDVRPHERTMPKPKGDRLDLLRTTRVNTSPIWGLSLAEGLSSVIDMSGKPDLEAVDGDGVAHRAWLVRDRHAQSAIMEAVASAPVVLADGHHRYETARSYRDELAAVAGPPELLRAAGLVMALVVELAEEQLHLGAIHRLIGELPGGFDLLQAFSERFDISEQAAPERTGPSAEGTGPAPVSNEAGPLLVTSEGSWLLRPKELPPAGAEPPVDSSLVEPVLSRLAPASIAYAHDQHEVATSVATGAAAAGLLLRPPTIRQIEETARKGMLMPPKTTYFWPKPRTGMVYRPLA
ncbi:MAG: DUF1015 family protein [Acidimicrobiales bacterium]